MNEDDERSPATATLRTLRGPRQSPSTLRFSADDAASPTQRFRRTSSRSVPKPAAVDRDGRDMEQSYTPGSSSSAAPASAALISAHCAGATTRTAAGQAGGFRSLPCVCARGAPSSAAPRLPRRRGGRAAAWLPCCCERCRLRCRRAPRMRARAAARARKWPRFEARAVDLDPGCQNGPLSAFDFRVIPRVGCPEAWRAERCLRSEG